MIGSGAKAGNLAYIDALRGIAALSVLVWACIFPLGILCYQIYKSRLPCLRGDTERRSVQLHYQYH